MKICTKQLTLRYMAIVAVNLLKCATEIEMQTRSSQVIFCQFIIYIKTDNLIHA